jgi:hypothetical protein
LEEKVAARLEIREYGRRDPSRWPRDTLYPQKLALASPTSGGRSAGIVRSWTQATEFSLVFMSRKKKLQAYNTLHLNTYRLVFYNMTPRIFRETSCSQLQGRREKHGI